MKKLLLLLIPLFFLQKALSQPVVFCPPGAEWHYLFDNFWTSDTNEEVKYVRDSIIGPETVKVLRSKYGKYYLRDNLAPGNSLTLIKQKGDTIFFKNVLTQGSWQILYNYAAQPGQGWQTNAIAVSGSSTSVTYSYTVNSVSSLTVNSFNLRVLAVTYTTSIAVWPATNPIQGSLQIIERYGGSSFLFNFHNTRTYTDGDILIGILCYQDSAFGVKQFSQADCQYLADVGLEEYSAAEPLKLFPNPSTDVVNLEINDPGGELVLHIMDISGRKLKQIKLKPGQGEHQIDLSGLSGGVYMISVVKDEKVVYTGKVVKQE
jgi:hypothetical protein